ncbi:CBL-interacting serine/threonine-protein kinase 20-like [Salvia divinorum]|uniref:CBL-interacting serine/threonine-protein kinase 20-like n=1 Tax=Salvia divinorum TaxID=28513 RepID=A0ABD1FLN8_SALDI
MDQFRQVGEVVGSVKALMVLKHQISINQRQCSLLADMMQLAFDTISEEMRHNLKLDEKATKWKALELPVEELHRVFKDAECYIRYCLDIKDWWGKAISLHMNRDCVELHIHNVLSCFTVVIEAIETAAEISGSDAEEKQRKRVALLHKYDHECDDLKIFLWKFRKQFLVPAEVCNRLETAWREDQWLLFDKVGERKAANSEQKLAELMLRKLNDVETSKKVMSSSILVGAQDYQVRRRLGSAYVNGPSHLKEIHWLGESFALRTFIGDVAPLLPEISCVLSLSHPNILQYLCAFYDKGRKEGYLVMDLMSKDLASYVKEHTGQKNHVPFSIPVAVDIMLQIARGVEYLHSKKICHGDLNPSNILLRPRNTTTGGFQVKVSGFGISAIRSCASRSPRLVAVDADIWLAPEVLAEHGGKCKGNYSEKADVYSFGMLCFELLTGKVPFEDGHLQGEQMLRNIRAGERPLFSYPSPKYLANLTKKCWQTNPSLRPSFSSICRILRYIKKILIINPDHGYPDSPPPLVDYCDMEAAYLNKFNAEGSEILAPVMQIPFQMLAYKIIEKEKTNSKKWDMVTEGMMKPPASIFDEEQLAAMDDLFLVPTDRRSVCSDIIDSKNSAVDVDLRTVISETMHRKLFQLDSFVPEVPRKRYTKPAAAESISPESDQNLSPESEENSIFFSESNKRLPEIPDRKGMQLQKTLSATTNSISEDYDKPEKKYTFINKLKTIKTKFIPESPRCDAPLYSPARGKKESPAAASSPSRALSKTTVQSPKKDVKRTVQSGMRSSNSPASSPARDLRAKNESSMYSPGRVKNPHSPASSPSRGYNACPSPIHPSSYHTNASAMSLPMNPNIRPSRLAGRPTALPSNVSPQTSKIDHMLR